MDQNCARASFGEVRSVDPGFVDGYAHFADMDAVKEVELHREFIVDNWKMD